MHSGYTDVAEKVAMWLEYGTRLVLVVNPRRRVVTVHRPGQPVRELAESDTVDGEDVVPGWRLPVRELFAGPLGECLVGPLVDGAAPPGGRRQHRIVPIPSTKGCP